MNLVISYKQMSVPKEETAKETRWFTLDELGSLGLWSETERIIRLAHEMWTVLRATPGA